MMMSVAVTSTRTTVRPVGTRPSCGATVVRFAVGSTVAHTGRDSTPRSVMSLPVRVPTRSVGRTSLGGGEGGSGGGGRRSRLCASAGPAISAAKAATQGYHGLEARVLRAHSIGRLPVPLTQAPAASRNDQRPDIAWSGLDGVERPAPGQNGVGWRLVEERETLAPSLQLGLLSCPTPAARLAPDRPRASP